MNYEKITCKNKFRHKKLVVKIKLTIRNKIYLPNSINRKNNCKHQIYLQKNKK